MLLERLACPGEEHIRDRKVIKDGEILVISPKSKRIMISVH